MGSSELALLTLLALAGLCLTACTESWVQLWPEYEELEGVDVVWQIPQNPKAVLLLLHGFQSSSTIFWDPTPNCAKCTGLPENRAITLAALDRGFAVIAVSSVTNWMQWPVEENVDVRNVVTILRDWGLRYGLSHLPLTALGTSHGGRFLSVLAHAQNFSSIVLMISAGNEDAVEAAYIRGSYPPTFFVSMPRDSITEASVKASMAKLKEKGIPVGSVTCSPIALHADYFTQRIPGLGLELSTRIVEALRHHGYLDAQSFLTSNVTTPEGWEGWYDAEDWEGVMAELQIFPLPNNPSSTTFYDGVLQELRLAYAFHSTTSLPSPAMLDWLEAHLALKDEMAQVATRSESM